MVYAYQKDGNKDFTTVERENGHRLRHDPRAIAVLLGWLDRIRSMQTHPAAEPA